MEIGKTEKEAKMNISIVVFLQIIKIGHPSCVYKFTVNIFPLVL